MNDTIHKQALPAGHRLGSYRIVRVLGVDGFGVTYLAEHTALGSKVAVKEYLPNEFAVRDGTEVHRTGSASPRQPLKPVLPLKLVGSVTKRNQHIVPQLRGWAVKPEGGKRPSSVHDTQQQAIDRGRAIARNQEVELLIHGRDGRIRGRDSHGGDPFPPPG